MMHYYKIESFVSKKIKYLINEKKTFSFKKKHLSAIDNFKMWGNGFEWRLEIKTNVFLL